LTAFTERVIIPIQYHMPLTALLSREVEGTALRNLGNRASLCGADGANSDSWILEDERALLN
jgi:hypothetical protein